MSDYCYNEIVVKGGLVDVAQVKAMVIKPANANAASEDALDFTLVAPIPMRFVNMSFENLDLCREAVEWTIANWGTKTVATNLSYMPANNDNTLAISFSTANAAPDVWFLKLCSQIDGLGLPVSAVLTYGEYNIGIGGEIARDKKGAVTIEEFNEDQIYDFLAIEEDS